MNTALFGAPIWRVLHTIPWLLPCEPLTRKQRRNLDEFLAALADTLPCIHCRNSYRVFLCAYPPYCSTAHRVTLAQWVFRLHNLVNLKLEKPLQSNLLTGCSAAACSIEEYFWALYDMLFIMGLNYPEQLETPECQRRRGDYARFLGSLSEIAPNLFSVTGLEQALSNRKTLLQWLYQQRLAAGLPAKSLDQLISEYEQVRVKQ